MVRRCVSGWLLVSLVLLFGSLPARAAGDHAPAPGEVTEELPDYVPGASRLEGEILTPCCWNQTLDIHNSPEANALKREIRVRLSRGESVDEVRGVIVERYGEKILAVKPRSPLKGFAVGLMVLVGLGGFGALHLLRSWRKRSQAKAEENAAHEDDAPNSAANRDELDRRLERELGQMEG